MVPQRMSLARATVESVGSGPTPLHATGICCPLPWAGPQPGGLRFGMRPRITIANRGFSLLEVVLVAAIVAILAAMAVPRYGSASARYRIDVTAGRVAADLRLAQLHARAASSSRTVCFDPATEEYLLSDVPAPDGASGNYRVALSSEPYRADLVSADFSGAAQLVFDGWGLPNSGGTIVVATGSQQRTITIDGTTGLVSVQ